MNKAMLLIIKDFGEKASMKGMELDKEVLFFLQNLQQQTTLLDINHGGSSIKMNKA